MSFHILSDVATTSRLSRKYRTLHRSLTDTAMRSILLTAPFLALTRSSLLQPFSSAVGAVAIRSKSRVVLPPWERFVHPNPFPPLAELEETTSVEEIDQVLDHITGTEGGVIIPPYKPNGKWLWKQFYGTILYSAWPRALWNMAFTTIFCFFVRYLTHGDFNVFTLVRGGDSSLLTAFEIIDKIWTVLMSLTTFLLTFFVGQAWTFWKSFIDVSRVVQGRFNSILMLLATHAARDDETGTYTPEAAAFLRDIGKRMKLFHTLHWACYSRRFYALLTEKGWDRMVARGLVSEKERKRLLALKVDRTQKQVAVFESMVVATRRGMSDKKVIGAPQTYLLEKKVLDEFCTLRVASATIADLVAGKREVLCSLTTTHRFVCISDIQLPPEKQAECH